MKATYIATCPPEGAKPEARECLSELLDLLCQAVSFPPDSAARAGLVERILGTKTDSLATFLIQSDRGVPPEALAACLARFSRSNTPIEKILEDAAGKPVEVIFKNIDYGHASIGGLTGGIAIAINDLSMLLAYRFFEFAQMADGQECSTRYITFSQEGLPDAADLGIPPQLQPLWLETCTEGFRLYNFAKNALDARVEADPSLARLPEKAQHNPKVKARMLKNYGLDRARYFLPFACKTSMAIVASARIWADILKLVEGLQWPEAIKAAEVVRAELGKVSPNLIKHSHTDNAAVSFAMELMQAGQKTAATGTTMLTTAGPKVKCRVDVLDGPSFNSFNTDLAGSLETRGTRYSHTGIALKRQTVRIQWDRIAIAELRDINRHRTGFRFSDFSPQGFYWPEETMAVLSVESRDSEARRFMELYVELVKKLARQGQTGLHAYAYFLGTQVPFEHTQQADKFLYEVELRTGLGAHFRYAEHLKQAAELYFEKYPETRKMIQLGDAEPE